MLKGKIDFRELKKDFLLAASIVSVVSIALSVWVATRSPETGMMAVLVNSIFFGVLITTLRYMR